MVVQRPGSMEIELVSSSNQGVIVYVSDNCTEEYDLEQTLLPSINRELVEPSLRVPEEPGLPLRKRRAAESIQPKCYGWSDVLSLAYEGLVSIYITVLCNLYIATRCWF